MPGIDLRTVIRSATASRFVLRVLLPLSLICAYGWLVEILVGWGELLRGLHAAGLRAVLLVGAGVALSYLLRSLRIQAVLPMVSRRDLPELVRLFALYNLGNWVLPARLGEAGLPLLLWRRYGVAPGHGTGVLLWLRLLDLHVLGVLAGVALLWQATGGWRLLGAVALAAGLLMPILATRGARYATGRWPRLASLLVLLPTRARAAGMDLALAWAAWLLKLAALGAVLVSLLDLPFAAGIVGVLGGDVAGSLPLHAPLGAGSYEAGVLVALTPWRLPLEQALAAAVQLHLLLLAAVLLLGAGALPALRRRAPVG